MPLRGEYEPGTAERTNNQVAGYEASDGRESNTLRDVPVVIVTTVGARSGKLRKFAVMRVEHGGEYAVVASKGGAPTNPVWYHNLLADPNVELQDGAERHDYVAHLAEGAERDAWWQRAVAVWPDYDAYQTRTERIIPLFVLRRADIVP